VDIPIEEYAKIASALLDIPVHPENKDRNLIESMHVLFTLYNGFKANQHFQNNNYESNIQSLQVG
jgi:intraflagellar transport protein 46